MHREPANLYREHVLRELPRLLSWQDREPMSKTCGSFDRTYWGWKFTDFPGARFQEGVYALAHLCCRDFPGNPLFGDERALDWARAGLRYWQSIQYRDGSFDEAYPWEHSLAATAFTSFYVGEAYLLLAERLPEAEQMKLRDGFSRAGEWLYHNDERHGVLSNHLAAAAAALQVIARICDEDVFARRSRYFLQRIYDHQSPSEGWYEEYGGADPGYQTHATFYLARVWQYTQDATLLESLRRSVEFLKYCLHPDGTLGGQHASRNTEFYFPAGLEMLAPALPDAAMIAEFLRPSVADQRAVGLAMMDAYNFLPLLNNYLFAAEHATELPAERAPLPFEKMGERYFADAGIFVKTTPAYHAILGLTKGGVLKVFDGATGRLHTSDCGYWAQIAKGPVISSQSLKRPAATRREDDTFTVTASFVEVNQRTQQPWQFVCFRLFTITLGRVPVIAYWVKDLLVRMLVRRRKRSPVRLTRQVRFEADKISVADDVLFLGRVSLTSLRRGTKFATIHMGSSRYFQPQELTVTDDPQNYGLQIGPPDKLRIKWEVDFTPPESS